MVSAKALSTLPTELQRQPLRDARYNESKRIANPYRYDESGLRRAGVAGHAVPAPAHLAQSRYARTTTLSNRRCSSITKAT